LLAGSRQRRHQTKNSSSDLRPHSSSRRPSEPRGSLGADGAPRRRPPS
jgi:hypothetical protein